MNDKLVLSIPEAAAMLGISRSLGYRLAKSNKLPVIKLEGRYLVPKSALERFLVEEAQKNYN